MPVGKVEVEGLRELQRNIRRAVDTDMPRRVGQANKRIGRFVKGLVDAQSKPEAVGKGAGAAVRPSATKREVVLRVGGRHRAGLAPQKQWGKRLGRDVRDPAPPRPYIRLIVERNRRRVEDELIDAYKDALSGVGDVD